MIFFCGSLTVNEILVSRIVVAELILGAVLVLGGSSQWM